MSAGWSAERPAPLEIVSTQTARKIRSKLCLPCDVSDGTHGLDRTTVRCTATSRSCGVTRSFSVFSVTFARARQDTPLAIGSNDMLNAVASQLLPYLMSGECHMFDLRWIAVLAFVLA